MEVLLGVGKNRSLVSSREARALAARLFPLQQPAAERLCCLLPLPPLGKCTEQGSLCELLLRRRKVHSEVMMELGVFRASREKGRSMSLS